MKLIKKMLLSALALVCALTAFASCGGGASKIEKPLADLSATVVEKAEIELPLMPIDNTSEYFDLASYTGLTDEAKVEEVIAYESAFGMQPFSLVFARVSDGTSAVDVAKEMDSKIDRRKWICVGADESRVASSADVVCFVMSLSEYEIDLDKIIDCFKTECGGKLSYQK